MSAYVQTATSPCTTVHTAATDYDVYSAGRRRTTCWRRRNCGATPQLCFDSKAPTILGFTKHILKNFAPSVCPVTSVKRRMKINTYTNIYTYVYYVLSYTYRWAKTIWTGWLKILHYSVIFMAAIKIITFYTRALHGYRHVMFLYKRTHIRVHDHGPVIRFYCLVDYVLAWTRHRHGHPEPRGIRRATERDDRFSLVGQGDGPARVRSRNA